MNKHRLSGGTTRAIALGSALLIAPLGFSQNDEEDDVFELSPFSVEGSENSGYRATSTLAGTRIRTDLKDVGSAISVVTEEFLRDTSATDNESLLVYTTGTEVGGLGGNFAGGGDGNLIDTDTQRLRPNQSTRVRGLAAANNTRDFFITDIPWDSYNVDRIDLQRGPNSILFGLGSPAGVINATTNSANYETSGDAEIRFGSHGSMRFSVDYNKVILEDELAIRVSGLAEDQKYMQDGAFEEDERYFVALKWDPKFLTTDSSRTTLKANYEKGDIEANRPRVIPPIDRITQWFRPHSTDSTSGMAKQTFDAVDVNNTDLTNGHADYSPWGGFALGRIFGSAVAVYDDVNQSTNNSWFIGGTAAYVGGETYQGVHAFDAFAKNAVAGQGLPAGATGSGLPGSNVGAYKSVTLSDPSIFDFYNKLIDGPNKSEEQSWESYNLALSHSMMDNKLSFELVYDKQEYQDRQTNVMDNSGQSISIDIMETLPNGSGVGTPNPNLGRPFIGGEAQNNFFNTIDRENLRFTGYYNLDFRKSESETLGNLLGHHDFTALYASSTIDSRSAEWIRAVSQNINPQSSITAGGRYIPNIVYIGDSLLNASSAAGANLSALQTKIGPTNGSTQYLNGDGISTTGPVNIWDAENGDLDNLWKAGSLSRDEITSKAFIWQGYLFDGLVVPLFGYRDDTANAANAGNIPNNPNGPSGSKLPFASDWQVPSGISEADPASNKKYASVSGINRTFSLVVHSPESVRDALGGLGVSLTYSNSENFRPDASRQDLIGNPIDASSGETKEYGIMLSSRDNRFNLKVNKYETKVFKDTLSSSSIANSYMIGAGEGWGNMFATWAAEPNNGFEVNNYALTIPDAPFDAVDNPYIDPSITSLQYQPQPGQSIADALAGQEAALGAIFNRDNNMNDPEFAQFLSFWNQDWTQVTAEAGWGAGGQAWAGEPGTFAVTGDTVSEGYEFELFYQPTDNWNIALNASKTEAKRLNIAESYASFVEKRWELYQGPYGDVRLWGPGNTTETIRSKFGSEFYSNFTLFQLLNDSNVAELRPWRYNLVTNYSFNDGTLGGLNVGGALRWQDEVVTGYPLKGSGTFEDPWGFDVDNAHRGGSESNVDLWAAYQKQLNDKLHWRVQLNIRNAFDNDRLIAITTQPDGSAATSRIAEGRTWTLTNTFSF